jgi:hypothetical protein
VHSTPDVEGRTTDLEAPVALPLRQSRSRKRMTAEGEEGEAEESGASSDEDEETPDLGSDSGVSNDGEEANPMEEQGTRILASC